MHAASRILIGYLVTICNRIHRIGLQTARAFAILGGTVVLADPDTSSSAAARVDLDGLAGYYRDLPKETARFSRDPEVLRLVAEASSRRLAVIAQLQATPP